MMTTLLGFVASDGASETGIPHSGGMSVGNGLEKNGVLSDLIPVNLERLVSARFNTGVSLHGLILTSLRFFCFKMAKRKRAMALSLLGDILTSAIVGEGVEYFGLY
jgi:hypothetical protein